jgi:hypothetical protein
MRSPATTASPNQSTSVSEGSTVIAPRQASAGARSVSDAPTRAPAQCPENLVARGVRIGRIAALSETGPLVDFDGNPTNEPLPARSSVRITPADVDRSAILAFEESSLCRPVIIGLVEESSLVTDKLPPAAGNPQDPKAAVNGDHPGFVVEADGRRLVVSAEQELVLRCGKSSVTLTKAGKILIRGSYLLSRSSGVNRIKGGSVQIN